MKNILIIGGSSGISAAVAELCLAQGHRVYLASRTKNEALKGAIHQTFDVLNDAIETLVLPEQIDGFVYAPGSINLRPFKMLKAVTFEKDFAINVMGLINTVQGILPKLMASPLASLVFYSTVAVGVGMPFHTSVAMAKGAVEGFARALAAEYAPQLRVNVVAPSLTQTPLAGRLLSSEEKIQNMGQRHPLKRVGTAEDIAQMTAFLLGEQSSWMTGQVLGVDGGLSKLNLS